LLICTAGIVGYFNIYGTILGEVLTKYNITTNQISVIGSIGNVGGISASIIFGFIIDKSKAYKKLFLILNSLLIVFHSMMTLSLEIFEGHEYLCALIFWTLINICFVPIYSISFDYACELGYPVGKILISYICNLILF